MGLPSNEMADSILSSQFGLPEGSAMEIEVLPDDTDPDTLRGAPGLVIFWPA